MQCTFFKLFVAQNAVINMVTLFVLDPKVPLTLWPHPRLVAYHARGTLALYLKVTRGTLVREGLHMVKFRSLDDQSRSVYNG